METLFVEFRLDPETEWWTATIPQVPAVVSQGKTLREAFDRVRDALGFVRKDAEAIRLEPEIVWDREWHVPDEVMDVVRAANYWRLQQLRVGAELEPATLQAVTVMIDKYKMPFRMAGQLLGITHQRVEQIFKSSKGAEVRNRQRLLAG